MTRKSVLHSVRLDDDVWAAIKALDCSLNQYLWEAFFDPRAHRVRAIMNKPNYFDFEELTGIPPSALKLKAPQSSVMSEAEVVEVREYLAASVFKPPLLKPKDRKR